MSSSEFEGLLLICGLDMSLIRPLVKFEGFIVVEVVPIGVFKFVELFIRVEGFVVEE